MTTKVQIKVLRFVDTFVAINGRPPYLADMFAGLGMAKGGLCEILNRLEQRGEIVRGPPTSGVRGRSISLGRPLTRVFFAFDTNSKRIVPLHQAGIEQEAADG